MNIYQMYNDLTQEIAIIEEQLRLCEKEREQWWFGGRLFAKHALNTSVAHADQLSERIEQLHDMLDARKQVLNRIDEHMNQFKGIEHKVAFKRYCKGMTLPEIAKELQYSLDYIKEISARVKLKEPS